MNVQTIELDLNKRTDITQIVRIGQGDKSGTTIRAKITDNGTVSLNGLSARFEMRLPNGISYYSSNNCTVSGDTITHVVDESKAATVAGTTHDAYFSILQGSTVVYSTGRFTVEILRAASDGADPSKSWASGFEEIIESAKAKVQEIGSELDSALATVDTRTTERLSGYDTRFNSFLTTSSSRVSALEDEIDDAITAANTRVSTLSTQLIDRTNTAASNANQAASNANDISSRASALLNTSEQKVDDAIERMEQVVNGKIEVYAMTNSEVDSAVYAALN